MKLIEYRHIPGKSEPQTLLATDSSITLPGKPVFLPEFAPTWKVEISVGHIISRLGKSIPQRFAARYFDSATLIVRFIPENPTICVDAPYSPLLTAFDGALARGVARPIGEFSPGRSLKFALTGAVAANAEVALGQHSTEVALGETSVEADISELSKFFILKTGDIIVSGRPLFCAPIAPDTHIEAGFSDAPDSILSFNVK